MNETRKPRLCKSRDGNRWLLWWDWYAAYMDARKRGSAPEEASAAAGRYMAEVKHVVVSPA